MGRSADCVTFLWLVGGLITRWPPRNLNHQPPCANHGLWDSLSITISQSLFKLMSIESVIPSNHLIFHLPLLLLPSIFASIRVFSNELALHIRWPKRASASASILPMTIQGWFPFRFTGLILLAVQETLKRLFQHHYLKASPHQHSAFFMVQLSHPYMTTGKTIALTI